MGTQTSKPLFGDEERRNRFRRPRTPINNNNSSASTTSISSGTVATSTAGDSTKTTWPCSNCHATVSNEETRCPYCGGIQVEVKIPRSPLSTTKAINSNLLLERLTQTPTTPVTRKEIEASKIQAFLSESATTSTMDYDEEDEEVDDNNTSNKEDNRPASALSQGSSLSQNFNIPIQRLQSPHNPQQQQQQQQQQAQLLLVPPFGSGSSPVPFSDRPPDPVALTLEAVQVRSGAPSPQVIFEAAQQQQQQLAFQQQHPQPSPALAKRKAATSGFEVPKKKMVLPQASST